MLAPLLLAAAAAGVAAAPPPSEATAQSGAASQCCFTHTNFYGVCVVVPGEDETCEDILAYLNSPNTVGRTYCNSSRIRGGWKQVDCTRETPESARAGTSPSRPCRCVTSTGESSTIAK